MPSQRSQGLNNPADIVTKYFNAEAAQRHLDRLHITRSKGRAGTAPVLATLEQQDADYWDGNDAGGEVARVHRKPRRELFTPRRVAGSPPTKALATLRVTTGRFVVSGRAFRIADSWTARAGAHRDFGEAWTGRTVFVKRSEEVKSRSAHPVTP